MTLANINRVLAVVCITLLLPPDLLAISATDNSTVQVAAAPAPDYGPNDVSQHANTEMLIGGPRPHATEATQDGMPVGLIQNARLRGFAQRDGESRHFACHWSRHVLTVHSHRLAGTTLSDPSPEAGLTHVDEWRPWDTTNKESRPAAPLTALERKNSANFRYRRKEKLRGLVNKPRTAARSFAAARILPEFPRTVEHQHYPGIDQVPTRTYHRRRAVDEMEANSMPIERLNFVDPEGGLRKRDKAVHGKSIAGTSLKGNGTPQGSTVSNIRHLYHWLPWLPSSLEPSSK